MLGRRAERLAPAVPTAAERRQHRGPRPDYLADAQTPNDAMSMPRDDAGDAWWARLGKTYALRIRFFGRDRALGDAASLKHEIIMLAQVSVRDGGHVAMQAQRCSDHGVVDRAWRTDRRLPLALSGEAADRAVRAGAAGRQGADRGRAAHHRLRGGVAVGVQARRQASQSSRPGLALGRNVQVRYRAIADARERLSRDRRRRRQVSWLSVRHMGINEGVEGARAKDSSQIVDGVLSRRRIRGSFTTWSDDQGDAQW